MDDDKLDVDKLLDGKPKADEEGLWDTIKTILYAVAIAVLVRTFAYEPFSIPSGSMIPTLLVGDYLFVSKMSYGYSRHSLPFSLPLLPDRLMYDAPERGDVAVFKLPSDGRTDFIKRIIGLPGDRIQVRGGILQINGKPVERKLIGDYAYQDTYGRYHNAKRYMETLPNGVSHEILEESDSYLNDNTPVFTVPEGHFFAMGDNRDNSRDSRYADVGYVPRENLVGRAEVLFFSNSGEFWEIWTWPWTIRFGRIFDPVD